MNPQISTTLELYKFRTTFEGDFIVHSTHKSDLRSRQRRVEVKTRWSREKELGSGAFGVVWREREEASQELRAVKAVPRRMLNVREVEALAELQDHPDLFVLFLGWFEDRDSIYLAMEYIEHGDLGQYIRDNPNHAKRDVDAIASQILEGLVVLHGRGICHRDIKPQNILIASLAPIWVKISDFGISKRTAGTALRTACGTACYRSPEQQGLLPRHMRTGNSYSTAVDLWALGVVIHEILTTQIPFLETYQLDIEIDSTPFTGEIGPQLDTQMLYGYCNGLHSFPIQFLQNGGVGEAGIAFVKGLMAANPADRVSAKDALNSLLLIRGLCTSVVQTELRGLEPLHTSETVDSRPLAVSKTFDHPGVASSSRLPVESTLHPTNLLSNCPPHLSRPLDISTLDPTNTMYPTHLVQKVLKLIALGAQDPFATGDYDLIRNVLTGPKKAPIAAPGRRFAGTQTDFVIFLGGYIKVYFTETGSYPSLLQVAAGEGRFRLAALLLRCGADVNLASGPLTGQTALQAATVGGHREAMRRLLKAGADVNQVPVTSRTLLQIATERGDSRALVILLRYNANLHVTPASGELILQIAAEHGHIDAARLLLDGGVDIDLVGFHGRGALHTAIDHGKVDFVRFLLDRKAIVPDDILLAASTQPEMKALLVEYGYTA